MRVLSILSATALVLVGISHAAPTALAQRSVVEIRSPGHSKATTEYSPYFSRVATNGAAVRNAAVKKRSTTDTDGEGAEAEEEEDEEEPEEGEDGSVASAAADKKPSTGVTNNNSKKQTASKAPSAAADGQNQQQTATSLVDKVTGLAGGVTNTPDTTLPNTPDLSGITGAATGAAGSAGLSATTEKVGQLTGSASPLDGLTDVAGNGASSSTTGDNAKVSADTLSNLAKPDDLTKGVTGDLVRSPEGLTKVATDAVANKGGSLL